jgi:hypothetical protein
MVREVAVIEKLIFEEVADAYVESAAIDALTVHVPGATNVTTPDAEPTVQTTAGEPEYVLAPAPAEAVLVSVGGEADKAYVDVYEPESILNVREINSGAIVVVVVVVDVVVVVATTSVMENLAVDDVAGYTPSLAIDAVT